PELAQRWLTFTWEWPLWQLIWHCDGILGMQSMAILEAALLGKQPASYQPGLCQPNQCTAVRLGLAEILLNQKDLHNWITRISQGTPDHHRSTPPSSHPFATDEAAANVLALVEAELLTTRACRGAAMNGHST
ncbi:MAG: hypothetical protein HQL59_08580, partial [Magnetococcales bacterium]|nr:hypothetical protein [Magnetococcales bacterium]